MRQYVFEVSFASCKTFIKAKLEMGYRYVDHISNISKGTVILILEMEDLV